MTDLGPKIIDLEYRPRTSFLPFHRRKGRWACLVAHRRAGKTVAAINDMVKRAMEAPPAPYHYFAPYRSQAKSVAWDYFKRYSRPLWSKDPNEAELKVFLLGGRTIQLYGADNADAARGQGSGGVYCDEYGDFRPSVWGNVIRPMLSERKGWGVFAGTPKGHNQFYDTWRSSLGKRSIDDADFDGGWFSLMLKASETGILDDSELRAAAAQLSEDQYLQEYECSFDAAILGAFYGKQMRQVDAEGRIGRVEYDPEFPVHTAWDLGRTDDTSIWWYQNIGNEIHLLDHVAISGGSIEEEGGNGFLEGSLIREIKKRPYRYGFHYLPHDAKAKTLAANGKSVIERLAKYLGISSLKIVPNLSFEDGVQAVRAILGRCWFSTRCDKDSYDGVEALRQCQRRHNEDTRVLAKDALHDWTSHPHDAFRMLAIAERRPDMQQAIPDRNKVIFVPPTLDQLWSESEEEQDNRLIRI